MSLSGVAAISTSALGVDFMDEPSSSAAPAALADAAGDDAAADAELIADQLDALGEASRWLSAELEHIATCRALLTQVTVNRLVALGERLRPAAAVRDRLARIEPARLLAGGAVWLARQPAARLEDSASTRAARSWFGAA